MQDYDGSQVLSRLALASGMRAAQRKVQSHDRGGDIEREARSFDALIEAVVLLQGSAEAWVNRLYDRSGVDPRSDSWTARWRGIGHVARALDRPMRTISSEHANLLDEVCRFRNFLVHGDAKSKQRLEQWSGGKICMTSSRSRTSRSCFSVRRHYGPKPRRSPGCRPLSVTTHGSPRTSSCSWTVHQRYSVKVPRCSLRLRSSVLGLSR